MEEASSLLADLEDPAGAVGVSSQLARLPELQLRAAEWSDRLAFDAISRIAASIPANLDFLTLIQELLDTAVQAVGGERGILFLGRHDDVQLVPAAARSIGGEDLKEVDRLSRTLLQRARLGTTVESDDALADPLFRHIESVRLARIRSVLCVPLLVRGALRGALYVDNVSAPAAFPETARRFLEAFAALAAVALEMAEAHGEILRENRRLRERLDSVESFGRILTVSPLMRATLRRAELAARADAPVMILGESGTGKELLARAIHEASPRASAPFVAHNCAAVPAQLMESIFFGHVRGAFTGALRDARGLFSLADRGVLFLDEIAELEPALQAKLLRVLEDGSFRPVGAELEKQVDVRLITATSARILSAVEDGRFRRDLYYRANVLEIQVPPLRDRREDIPMLVEHLIHRYARPGRSGTVLSPDALEYLQTLPWKGNVRELSNLVQRVLVFCPEGSIGAEQVMALCSPERTSEGGTHGEGRSADASRGSGGRDNADGARECGERPTSAVRETRPALPDLWQEERERVIEALRRARGNKSEAARQLGLERNAFLRRLRRLGIGPGRR